MPRSRLSALLLTALLSGGSFMPVALAQQDAAQPPAQQPTQPTPAESTTEPAPGDAGQVGAEQSSLTLVRRSEKDGKDRQITIVRTGTSDETGIFALCQPQDADLGASHIGFRTVLREAS